MGLAATVILVLRDKEPEEELAFELAIKIQKALVAAPS